MIIRGLPQWNAENEQTGVSRISELALGECLDMTTLSCKSSFDISFRFKSII